MQSSTRLRVCSVLLAVAACGCEPMDLKITKKPSYSELVATYNAEVQTLDNLEDKRKRLIAESISETYNQAIKAAAESMTAAAQSGKAANPNDALDRAVAAAQSQAELQQGVFQSLGQPSGTDAEGSAAEAKLSEDGKRKLAELDAEIAAQKERVERARAARDAAAPK